MDPALLAAVEELFEAARAHSPEAREAWLAANCEDESLREVIRELLANDEPAQSFFDGLQDEIAAVADDALDGSHVAQQFGPYRTVRLIGRGGMGSVYEAERSDGQFEQRVAIKLIRRGMETDDAVSRFLAERRILARLEHRAIARLIDGGLTDDGRPFFVMEFVEGQPLHHYCAERSLPLAKRLRLFLGVADAVAFAHRNLVVHRDLKPSNVLVTSDGDPKLLDFGIAKPLLDTEESGLTRTGARAMTPDYAAPEQIRAEAITTATDVYGLGLLLYELITGRRPHEGKTASSAELELAILRDDPVRPSAAVRRESPGRPGDGDEQAARTAEAVAAELGTTPARLARALRGDLDTICMTALRKEPERRYDSVRRLAEDVRRHLDGEPVLARPDTFAYRAGKFVRRHRLGVAAGVALALLTAGYGISLARQWDRTQRERDKAERVAQLLIELLVEADPVEHRGHELTAREVLDRGARRVDELGDQPDVQATLTEVMGRAYRNLGAYDRAEPLLRKTVALQVSLYGGDDVRTADARRHLGDLLRLQGRYDEAEALLGEALSVHRAEDHEVGAAADLVVLARLRHAKGDYERALAASDEAIAIVERVHGSGDEAMAEALNDRAAIFAAQGRLPEAEEAYGRALEIERARLGADHPSVPATLNNLAGVLSKAGRLAQAEQAQREALTVYRTLYGEDVAHPAVATTLSNLGVTRFAQGDAEGAEPLLREALAMRRETLDDAHPEIAQTASHLGLVLQQEGRLDQAEPLLRESLQIREALGREHPLVAHGLNNLALLQQERGDLDEAERLLRRAIEILEASLGAEHPMVAQGNNNLGGVLFDLGRLDESRTHYERALGLRRAALPAKHPHLAYTLLGLGRVHCASGEAARGESLLREALEIRREVRPPDHWEVGEAEAAFGACLQVLGRTEEARPLLRQGYETLLASRGADDRRTRLARAELDAL